MNFYQKYELERLVADGETKTFRAVENATGRRVFLHFFNPEGLPILAALKSKLGKTPGKPVLPLIELGEFAGSPYAVTEPISQFTTLRQWVNSLPGGAVEALAALPADVPKPIDDTTKTVEIPKPPLAPEPRPVPEARAGEFTRMFEAPVKPSPVAETPAGEFTRMFEAPPKPAQVAETQGGEFTRFFGDAKEPPKPQKPSSPPKPSTSPAQAGGEFTQFFGAVGATPKPPAPEPKPKTPDAGEFTGMFNVSPAATSKPTPQPRQYNEYQDLFGDTNVPAASKSAQPPSSQPSWPVSAPAELETGQFTKLFGSGPSGEAINIEEEQARAARAKQPESRPFQAPTEFTRVFGPQDGANVPPARVAMPMDGASAIFGSIDELKTVAPAPTKSAGPGEYTRMMTRAELEAERPAAEQQPMQLAPAPAAKRNGLVIGLAIGSVALIIVIIVFLILAQKH